MEILTKYNIGDSAYIIEGINIYEVTIDNINVKVTKSFGEEYIEINYDITAHTNGYINFIPSSSPISEEKLFNSPDDIINNIKIKN